MGKPTFTIEEIKEAQEYAKKLQLRGFIFFCSKDPKELQAICNGTGADWMPEKIRKLLDKRHPTLVVPVMIHDVEYWYGIGTTTDFHLANEHLYENGCLVAKDKYWCINPRRYVVMWDAYKLYQTCELFGRKAYDEAVANRRKAEQG